jgi:hypothetical protein
VSGLGGWVPLSVHPDVIFFFWQYRDLNSEPLHQPFFVMGFFEMGGLSNYLLGLALNCDLPDLCLLSSWDYKCETPVPGSTSFFTSLLLRSDTAFLKTCYVPGSELASEDSKINPSQSPLLRSLWLGRNLTLDLIEK